MTVDQAIEAAVDHVKRYFPGDDYRLEEVEAKDDGGFALTISFRGSEGSGTVFEFGPRGSAPSDQGKRVAIGIDRRRMYKEVDVDRRGAVKATRMRTFVLG